MAGIFAAVMCACICFMWASTSAALLTGGGGYELQYPGSRGTTVDVRSPCTENIYASLQNFTMELWLDMRLKTHREAYEGDLTICVLSRGFALQGLNGFAMARVFIIAAWYFLGFPVSVCLRFLVDVSSRYFIHQWQRFTP